MVTTNFGLVLGPLLDLEGPKEGPFWHKMTLFGPKRANMGPKFKMSQTYHVVILQEKGTQPIKKKHCPNFEFGLILGPMWFKKGHL